MFGLTKREQRWKAEQEAAETISKVIIAGLNAKAAMGHSEALTAIADRDARIYELEAQRDKLAELLREARRFYSNSPLMVRAVDAALSELTPQ